MLNNSIRILNFDDSVVRQRDLLSQYRTEIIDLKDIGPRARFWINAREEEEIRRRIRNSAKDSVTFLGSGDFHQVSSILISSFEEPISVIDFDFHTDWNMLPPRLSCGSWVTESLRNANVLKHILIGVSSDGASNFFTQTGNFASLKNDRVEIYPYSRCPFTVFFRKIPPNISTSIEKGPFSTRVCWNELKDKDLGPFFLHHILERLPTKQVYISIDKDCLKKQHSLTNWQEGELSLDELLLMIKLIKENLDIVGADVTGDYSRISTYGIVKKTISRMNHPKNFSAKDLPEAHITAVNEKTNLKIAEILTS